MKLRINGEDVEAWGTPAERLALVEGRVEPLPVRGGWGRSFEDAVVISVQAMQDQGIPVQSFIGCEKAFLAGFFLYEEARRRAAGEALLGIDYKVVGQSLEENGGRVFDRISVEFGDRTVGRSGAKERRDFLFDITEPFGHHSVEGGSAPRGNSQSKKPGGTTETSPAIPMWWKATAVVGATSGLLALSLFLAAVLILQRSTFEEHSPVADEPPGQMSAAPPEAHWLPSNEVNFIRWHQAIEMTDSGECSGGFYHVDGSGLHIQEVLLAYDIVEESSDAFETRYVSAEFNSGHRPGEYGRFRTSLYPYELLGTDERIEILTGRPLTTPRDILRDQVGFEITGCRIHALRVYPERGTG